MPKAVQARENDWHWESPGGACRFWLGDVLENLRKMPSGSVHCAVTSPPYFGLRDYKTGTWEGGSTECDHATKDHFRAQNTGSLNPGGARDHGTGPSYYRSICAKCGAKRIDRQLGSKERHDCLGWAKGVNCAEASWADGCFVCRMVLVFRELRRVLRDDGVLWLNLGDSYNANTGAGFNGNAKRPSEARETRISGLGRYIKSGNLLGVPWRVALALQADGWILRSDVPWVKRSAMPESVRNRPCKALEYVFMFVKRQGYYFDMESVRKESKGGWSSADFLPNSEKDQHGDATAATMASRSNDSTAKVDGSNGRAFRQADLWFESVDSPRGLVGVDDELVGLDVTSEAYSGSHFATFPSKLIEPLIKCSTSEWGCCGDCGAPWRRVMDRPNKRHWTERNEYTDSKYQLGDNASGRQDGRAEIGTAGLDTIGWEPSCNCHGWFRDEWVKVERPISVEKNVGDHEKKAQTQGDLTRSTLRAPKVGDRDRSLPGNRNGISGSLDGVERRTEAVLEKRSVYVPEIPPEEHPVASCVVLDPFLGSGTTALTSMRLGCRCWGIELSERYLRDHAIRRVKIKLAEGQAPVQQVPGLMGGD